MASRLAESARDERGIALVVTILLLLLVSGIGIMALNRAGDEKLVAGASRRQLMNLSAAEAGLRMVQEQLKLGSVAVGAEPPPITIGSTPVATDKSNQSTRVFTGTMSATGPVITPIQRIGKCELEGHDQNSPVGCVLYRVDVTATDPAGGSTHVQAQYRLVTSKSTSYGN
jgi:hypothetical protein